VYHEKESYLLFVTICIYNVYWSWIGFGISKIFGNGKVSFSSTIIDKN